MKNTGDGANGNGPDIHVEKHEEQQNGVMIFQWPVKLDGCSIAKLKLANTAESINGLACALALVLTTFITFENVSKIN